jgi:hypothetical protein
MKVDTFTGSFADDVSYAFGGEAASLWEEYRLLAEQITKDVEGGRYPKVEPKAVGILHRLVKQFEIPEDRDFTPALNRISIDKDYYGSAMIGMGDLIAIRSVERSVAARVEQEVFRKLDDRPLVRNAVEAIRSRGHSNGVSNDIRLAELVLRPSLIALLGLAVAQNGLVTSDVIEQVIADNGIETADVQA